MGGVSVRMRGVMLALSASYVAWGAVSREWAAVGWGAFMCGYWFSRLLDAVHGR